MFDADAQRLRVTITYADGQETLVVLAPGDMMRIRVADDGAVTISGTAFWTDSDSAIDMAERHVRRHHLPLASDEDADAYDRARAAAWEDDDGRYPDR